MATKRQIISDIMQVDNTRKKPNTYSVIYYYGNLNKYTKLKLLKILEHMKRTSK